SCWPNSQDGIVTDAIELWVAANATWLSGRSHSAAYPLHVPGVAAGASSPPPVMTMVAAPATAAIATAGARTRETNRAARRPADPRDAAATSITPRTPKYTRNRPAAETATV